MDVLQDMPDDMVPFVTMPCGCVGIKLHGDHYLAIVNCDGGGDGRPSLSFDIRTHNGIADYPALKQAMAFKPITKEEFVEILASLNQMVQEACAWTSMRQLINYAERGTKDHIIEELKAELQSMVEIASTKADEAIKAEKAANASNVGEMPVTERAV